MVTTQNCYFLCIKITFSRNFEKNSRRSHTMQIFLIYCMNSYREKLTKTMHIEKWGSAAWLGTGWPTPYKRGSGTPVLNPTTPFSTSSTPLLTSNFWPNFKCYFRFEGLRVVLGVRIVSQAVLRQENQNFGLSKGQGFPQLQI